MVILTAISIHAKIPLSYAPVMPSSSRPMSTRAFWFQYSFGLKRARQARDRAHVPYSHAAVIDIHVFLMADVAARVSPYNESENELVSAFLGERRPDLSPLSAENNSISEERLKKKKKP